MKTYNKVCKDIERIKAKLKTKLITENFGEKEARKLRDKYDYCALQDIDSNERNMIFAVIRNFDEWCNNYTGE